MIKNMNKSVVKYMIVDLGVLIALGCILEGLTSRFIGFALDAAPTVTFSLLIVFIAVCRWKAFGLITIPFLVFSMILGGHFSDLSYYAAFYSFSNWQLYLSVMIGLACGFGINLIFFRNQRTNKITKVWWQVLLLLVLDYLVYCLIQFVLYRLFMGNLMQVANVEYTYNIVNSGGVKEPKTVNLAMYVERGFIYNSFGLIVAMLGAMVLRSQGVLNNAIEKLIDDKKERELEFEYLKNAGNLNWDPQEEPEASKDESNKNEDSSEQF